VAHRWGERCEELGRPFDVILACETLYWGGWDLLSDDTRDAQLATLLQVCVCVCVYTCGCSAVPRLARQAC
jgi:hypothetical protein